MKVASVRVDPRWGEWARVGEISLLDLPRRTINLRRSERARNEGTAGPTRLDDTRGGAGQGMLGGHMQSGPSGGGGRRVRVATCGVTNGLS